MLLPQVARKVDAHKTKQPLHCKPVLHNRFTPDDCWIKHLYHNPAHGCVAAAEGGSEVTISSDVFIQ